MRLSATVRFHGRRIGAALGLGGKFATAEETMAFGLYVTHDGSVMVAYGQRRIPISCAEYKANGYKPALDKLAVKFPVADKLKVCAGPARCRGDRPSH